MSPEPHAVTLLLNRIRQGSAEANNELVALIYERLRQLAHRQRRGERPGHTLATCDLVQEGLQRLLRDDEIAKASNRLQLFGAFTRALRQLLIDYARKRNAAARGGGWRRVELDEALEDVRRRSGTEALNLDEALDALAAAHPREAEVVEMRLVGGFEMAEIADALGVSLSTVERHHRFARAWLHDYLSREGGS